MMAAQEAKVAEEMTAGVYAPAQGGHGEQFGHIPKEFRLNYTLLTKAGRGVDFEEKAGRSRRPPCLSRTALSLRSL